MCTFGLVDNVSNSLAYGLTDPLVQCVYQVLVENVTFGRQF